MLRLVKFIIPIVILTSCKKYNFQIENLNGNRIAVIGHGGMGINSAYPSNSLESILKCLDSGADGVEIDIQMTTDGVFLAYHDDYLENLTNGSGSIYNQTWGQIAGTEFKEPIYANYSMVTLETILNSIESPARYTFFFHCKNISPDTSSVFLNEFVGNISELLDTFGIISNSYVQLGRADMISKFNELRPDISLFSYPEFDTGIELASENNIKGITVQVDRVSAEQIQIAHDLGLLVAIYGTHKKKKNIEAVEKNPDFIQTDKVKYLMDILP